jgi:N,N'-diacetyllegionaminate synthase
MKSISIAGRDVGENAPAFVLAEVASAHQGEAVQALALAKQAQAAGADGVKFQLFRAGDLIAPNDPRYSTFEQIELSLEDWDQVLGESRGLGLALFGEVFDRESLTLAERHDLAAYKIHSTDIENPEFIRAIAATGKPLLLATGGSGLGAIEAAIEVARTEGNEKLMLLHGVQNFPTRVEDSHLLFLATLKSLFGLPVGFLDHVDGGSAMAITLPALAVAFGADLVEKHITLDRTAKGFDYESALEKETFASMVELIRQSEKAFGSPQFPSGASASRYHRLMRRAILSRVELKKGEPLTRDKLAFLRCETGLPPYDAPRLLGRKPRRDIAPFEPLSEDQFE